LFSPLPQATSTCEQQFAAVETRFIQHFRIESLRLATQTVQNVLAHHEIVEFFELAKQFDAIPHDSPEHVAERFRLQSEAKKITRMAAARADYPLLNPATGSPYDAVIKQIYSTDGILETSHEIRGLLIQQDPLPHLTLWMHRNDQTHNPWHVISIGVTAEPSRDYASWVNATSSIRETGSIRDFLKTWLPASCR